MAGWEPQVMHADSFKGLFVQYGWTQQEFADQLGVSLNTVSRWANSVVEIPEWMTDYVDAMCVLMPPGQKVPAPKQLTAETLKEVLAELNWSQVYLSRRIQVAKSTIYRWTTGENIVPAWCCAYLERMLEVRRIAVRLGVTR